MTRKYSATWRNVLASASAVTLIFSSLLMQSAEALTSNPAPVCIGASCTVTFAYSGDSYSWSPPAGATSVSFDLQGAQGGAVGGKGGRVTGTFLTAPTSLLIYVGGTGTKASGAQGGFNGGGAAGVGFGDEGSGGGATDLRTTSALSSRVAIAAGGGGSGGAIGGAGGIGGGLQGYAGAAAQTEGGSGGTQTYGGRGGLAYGGTNGTAGTQGQGGVGGSSAYSAGGGGGGGLFGGGGGGATLEDCCYGSGAGGGAGGSSFASASVVASPTHTLGFRSGSGLAKISYVAPPEVLSFATGATLSNQDTIAFALIFNQGVSGLVVGDFSQSENPCSTAALTGSEANYTITLAGCPNGNHSLILASNSVTGAAAGPAQSVSSNSILLDLVAPQATWSTTSSTSFDSPIFEINFDESVSGLVVADLNQPSASQCTLALIELTAGTKYLIETTSCGYGQVQLSLSAGSVTDAAMNPGLASQSASVVYAQQPVATPAPTAEPTQTPTPTAEPTQAPIAEALPVIPSTPEPPSASDSMAPVEAAPVEAAPIEPAPITTQTPEVIETLLPFDEATIDASIAESSFATAPLSASIDLPITETPAKALPQEIQSVPLQVMQAVSQESTKPDLIGWAYLAVGIVGAAAVSVGAASVASTFRSRRRLLTS